MVACVIDPGFGEVFEYHNYCFGCLCDGSVICWWLIDDDDSAVRNWLVHGNIVQWVAIHLWSLDKACTLLKFSGLVVRVHTIEGNWITNICYHLFSEQLSNSLFCTSVQQPNILVFCEPAVDLLVHNRINDLVIFSDLFIFLSNISSGTSSLLPSVHPPLMLEIFIHIHCFCLCCEFVRVGACFYINHCEY